MRPTLRSDTLKIKAIDLCSGRDFHPARHALLLCNLSVSGAECVLVCARVSAHTSISKIICVMCVYISITGQLGLHGAGQQGFSTAFWGIKVGLKDFHLAWSGKWEHAGAVGRDNCVCEAAALPLMKSERRCRQTGSRLHSKRPSLSGLNPFLTLPPRPSVA